MWNHLEASTPRDSQLTIKYMYIQQLFRTSRMCRTRGPFSIRLARCSIEVRSSRLRFNTSLCISIFACQSTIWTRYIIHSRITHINKLSTKFINNRSLIHNADFSFNHLNTTVYANCSATSCRNYTVLDWIFNFIINSKNIAQLLNKYMSTIYNR